ncbi:transposase [Streptomyces sp. NPDC059866]|uniref:transposase n=1 Tax=Streptomyces sp. NPDC059866 TaxID=3346978 RepID=UPI003660BEAF
MPRSCPPEFRRRVLDLVASGRKTAEVAKLLGISEQTIYVWRRQHLIDTGQMPGVPSNEQAELAAARKRIAELEAELAVHRRAAEPLGEAPGTCCRPMRSLGPASPGGSLRTWPEPPSCCVAISTAHRPPQPSSTRRWMRGVWGSACTCHRPS